MEITRLGHSCFKIRGKQCSLLIDPFDPETTGLKMPKVENIDAVLITHDHRDHSAIPEIKNEDNTKPVIIKGPGEYEIKGAQIIGVSSFHDDKNGAERGKNTIYQMEMEGLTLVHFGDLGQKLTLEQIEQLNTVEILMIPVGGILTIDASVAAETIAQLEPSIVLPMHYGGELEPVDKFLKTLGKEAQRLPKLVITKEKLPIEMQVIILEN